MKVNILEKNIEFLDLNNCINKILKDNNLILIKDLWSSNRKLLKGIGLSDRDIQSIIVKLQLNGLDLNKRKY